MPREQLQEHASRRRLRTSWALSEVPPHRRGGELGAAAPTAEHAWPRRSSAPIGLSRQVPDRFLKRWPPRTIREMAPHLAGRELGAAAPPAQHPRPWRSTNEVDGFRVQSPNLYPNPTSAPAARP